MVFEKTLTDLVTGIRSHKRDTALYISQNIAEIKNELQSPDFFTKSNALQKLTFLQMLGYSMSWAAFASVEVMSSPRFALKRIGYLAACQGLDRPDESPVVLLTTNLLKKELRGATVGGSGENMYHAGLAINCISNIVTEDLGMELLPDLLHLLKHPSPYVRKKALLCLYKVFLKYPRGLRLSFDAIKSCLENDSHPSVVSCAVNVITELSDKNPKNYLPLAPAFFKLLTSSANNWMLIKVVKLLGSLVPEEPRLARKLLEPLSNMVKSTHAKSLLYEAVFAITLCLQYVKKANGTQPSNIPEVLELCVETLRGFVSDPDQNLKYLGLVGFGSLLQSQPNVLHSQSECRGLILKCLSDDDITIRTRALSLLQFVTTQRNLVDLINQLLGHVESASGDYRCDLVQEIIRMCSSNKYELVTDFAWYVDVLLILAGVRGVKSKGEAISKQWMDVAWRVLPVRSYAVRRSLEVLVCRGLGVESGENGSGGEGGKDTVDRYIIPEVLPAAAWIVGEYSHLIPEALEKNEGLDPRYDASSKGPYHALIQSMTSPTDATGVNPLLMTTQAVFIQNTMKVFAAACERNNRSQDSNGTKLEKFECTDDELYACVCTLMKNLVIYCESPDVEVKERSFTAFQLLLSIDLPRDLTLCTTESVASKCRLASSMLTYLLVPEPMKPISAKTQKKKLAEGPPSPISIQEFEQDVDWDAFSFVNEETLWFDCEGKPKGSLESICFTKQHSNTATNFSGGTDIAEGARGPQQRGELGEVTEIASLSASGYKGLDTKVAFSNFPASSNRRGGDPFYLSSPSVPSARLIDTSVSGDIEGAAIDAADTATTRFGSIKLDSGGESDEGNSGAKMKKKKKNNSNRSMKAHQFVASDDEDDNNNVSRSRPKRGYVSKELKNLALVDLTTPLGEDDVMPRNEHYVVPERQAEPKVSTKKSKKMKLLKKNKSSKSQASTAVSDLLSFDSPPIGSDGVKANSFNVRSSNNIPISSAFDDLLGLEMFHTPLDSSNNSAMVPIAEASSIGGNVVSKKSEEKKQKKGKHKSKKSPKKTG